MIAFGLHGLQCEWRELQASVIKIGNRKVFANFSLQTRVLVPPSIEEGADLFTNKFDLPEQPE